jgi:hypothetical protein
MLNWTDEDSHNSTDQTKVHEPYPWSIVGLSSVVVVMGLVASSYDIFSLRQEKWQNLHFYLLAITFIDIIAILLDFPGFVLVAVLNTGNPWPLGKPMCLFWLHVDWFTNTSNTLVAMALHLEYYFSRKDEDNRADKKTIRQTVFFILVILVVSTILSLPVLVLFNQQEITETFFCSFNHFDSLWLLPYFVGGCILPLTAVIVYDICLLVQLIRERSLVKKPLSIDKVSFSKVISTSSSQVQFLQPDLLPNSDIIGTVLLGERTCDRRKKLIILGLMFLLCYGPWLVCCLLSHWVPESQNPTLLSALYWPVMLFPIIHPAVLGLCHRFL